MRITVDGHRINKSTGEKVHPDHWETKTDRVITKAEHAEQINLHLSNLEVKVKEVRNQLVRTGEPVTAESIRDEMEVQRPAGGHASKAI